MINYLQGVAEGRKNSILLVHSLMQYARQNILYIVVFFSLLVPEVLFANRAMRELAQVLYAVVKKNSQ